VSWTSSLQSLASNSTLLAPEGDGAESWLRWSDRRVQTSRTTAGESTPSKSQLSKLAEHGEERTTNAGDLLYRVGDHRYSFVVMQLIHAYPAG
jgi:hypothetical protein